MDKSGTKLIPANGDQEQPGIFCEILLAKTKMPKYLKKKCYSNHNQQLSFKYFVKIISFHKLLPKLSWIQTTISRGTVKHK